MLPPETPLCGSGAHSLPSCAAISRAMASKPPSSISSSPISPLPISPLTCTALALECSAGDSGIGTELPGDPLALTAQQRSEAETVVERFQSRKIRCFRPQVGCRNAQRHVADDAGQPSREEDRLTMRAQPFAERTAAAHPEGGHEADIRVELIERA